MATAPADVRDQHIADLRASLEHATRLLAYCAGLHAATDPKHSEDVMAAVDGMKDILTRTGPSE
jgi:hypothetical protein